MVNFTPEMHNRISLMGKELKLADEVISFAENLFEQVTQNKELHLTRIDPLSVAVSCIYIASSLKSDKKISQYELTYKYKISPTTIRKTYHKICRIMGLSIDDVLARTGQVK
jgi:transcription initiation factor TFIIIB Brf1 subunit/transcription initiation factor TFIIB